MLLLIAFHFTNFFPVSIFSTDFVPLSDYFLQVENPVLM